MIRDSMSTPAPRSTVCTPGRLLDALADSIADPGQRTAFSAYRQGRDGIMATPGPQRFVSLRADGPHALSASIPTDRPDAIDLVIGAEVNCGRLNPGTQHWMAPPLPRLQAPTPQRSFPRGQQSCPPPPMHTALSDIEMFDSLLRLVSPDDGLKRALEAYWHARPQLLEAHRGTYIILERNGFFALSGRDSFDGGSGFPLGSFAVKVGMEAGYSGPRLSPDPSRHPAPYPRVPMNVRQGI